MKTDCDETLWRPTPPWSVKSSITLKRWYLFFSCGCANIHEETLAQSQVNRVSNGPGLNITYKYWSAPDPVSFWVTYWSSLRPNMAPGSASVFLGTSLSKSRMVLAADCWGVLGGLMGWRPEGVSDNTWKCDVGGGPIGVGRLSMSTCTFKHKKVPVLQSQHDSRAIGR